MNLSQITVNVNDMDTAVDFYEGKLGFQVLTRAHTPHVVVLQTSACPLVLRRVEMNQPNDATHVVIAFDTDAIDDEFARLKSAGVELLQDEPSPFPAGRMLSFRDPSGNVFEMIERKN